MKKIFFGKIKDGRIEIKSYKIFADDIRKCEGKDVLISVEDRYRIRSEKQNRYYWGVVIRLIAESTGYESEEVHQLFKKHFLSYKKKSKQGQILEFTKSTAELNWQDFNKYIEQIKTYVRDNEVLRHIVIPDPDPNYYNAKQGI